MTSFTATVQSVIPGPPAVVFDRVMPIDLASIFPGYGPLPAVTGLGVRPGPGMGGAIPDGAFIRRQFGR